MGDRDHRPPVRERSEGLLEGHLGLRIERGRGLVEHDHGRVGERDASDRDELALARRQPHAA